MHILLADPQDITRAGMMFIAGKTEQISMRQVADKTELLFQLKKNADSVVVMDYTLLPTETEILKDIAMGYTTKEIAERRFSSFHTVNTHRKNIFRKLSVNNIHEATRYALRAGLVDAAEYYI